jgi:hypothetical protein
MGAKFFRRRDFSHSLADGVVVGRLVCFFIGREDNPATGTGPLPSHSILLVLVMRILSLYTTNHNQAPAEEANHANSGKQENAQ